METQIKLLIEQIEERDKIIEDIKNKNQIFFKKVEEGFKSQNSIINAIDSRLVLN